MFFPDSECVLVLSTLILHFLKHSYSSVKENGQINQPLKKNLCILYVLAIQKQSERGKKSLSLEVSHFSLSILGTVCCVHLWVLVHWNFSVIACN